MTPADVVAGALTLGLLAAGSWIVWRHCSHDWKRTDSRGRLGHYHVTVWTCGRCGRRREWSEFF